MKKLKGASQSYIVANILFWVVFIGLVVFSQLLISLFNLNEKEFAGMKMDQFIGIFFVVGFAITLILMLLFSTVLLKNAKYAAASNYKAEAKWSKVVFVFNLIFNIIFIAYFVINVLFVVQTKNKDGVMVPMLENKELFNITKKVEGIKDPVVVFTVKISVLLNWFAAFGVFSSILSLSLAIAISGRASNVNKKIKEYERVNIY